MKSISPVLLGGIALAALYYLHNENKRTTDPNGGDINPYNPPPRTIHRPLPRYTNGRAIWEAQRAEMQRATPQRYELPSTLGIRGNGEAYYSDGWDYYRFARMNGYYSDRTVGLNKYADNYLIAY